MSKDKVIRARISNDDYKTFIKRVEKSGLTKSAFLRQCATQTTIYDTDPLRKLYFELKKEGNNLNQLVRQLNQYDSASKNELKKELKVINKLYREIKDHLIELY